MASFKARAKIFGGKISPNGKNDKYIIWGIILVVVYFVGKQIVNGISQLFQGMNDEEEQLSDAIDAIEVDWDKVTITEEQAVQRASAIHNAMAGMGTDENTIIKSLMTSEAAAQVNLTALEGLDFFGEGVEADVKLSYWKEHEDFVALSDADYDLIGKKFGLKAYGMVSIAYATLGQWLRDDLEPAELRLMEYIFRNSQIQI